MSSGCAREHFSHYPARSGSSCAGGCLRAIARRSPGAACINPADCQRSFIQQPPGRDGGGRRRSRGEDVLAFHKVGPRTHWSYLSCATAGWRRWRCWPARRTEPDYGHDINLFSDN